MQSIGQLDDHNPKVFGHSQKDLSQILGAASELHPPFLWKLFAPRFFVDVVGIQVKIRQFQLGHAIHKRGNLATELSLDVVRAVVLILNDVV